MTPTSSPQLRAVYPQQSRSPQVTKRLARGLLGLLTLALAAAASAAPAYFIQADIVRGALGAQGAVCVPNAVFMQGEEIVWRAYVYDATTGEKLTQDEIDARGVKVYGEIETDAKAELTYEPHPPGADKTEVYYAGAWSIPADFPTGNYKWSVAVEDSAGNTASYKPMGQSVGLGVLNILAAQATTGAAEPSQPASTDASSADQPDSADAPTADQPASAETANQDTTAQASAEAGKKVFDTQCAACHQAEGTGIPGAFPPLANNEIITADDPTFITRVVLFGLTGKIEVNGQSYNGSMPAWEAPLSDDEIAAVLTYIRSAWGNDASAVDADSVAAERAKGGSAADNYANYPE